MDRLGQNGNPCPHTLHNHIYVVCIRYFWQGNHQTYGHVRCIYTVLANPTSILFCDARPVHKLKTQQPTGCHAFLQSMECAHCGLRMEKSTHS